MLFCATFCYFGVVSHTIRIFFIMLSSCGASIVHPFEHISTPYSQELPSSLTTSQHHASVGGNKRGTQNAIIIKMSLTAASSSSSSSSSSSTVRECLAAYCASLEEVVSAGRSGASSSRRSFLESDCAYRGVELVGAVEHALEKEVVVLASPQPSATSPSIPAAIPDLTRLLLAIPDRTSNALAVACRNETTGPEASVSAAFITAAVEQVNIIKPRESIALKDLPGILRDQVGWSRLVVAKVMCGVLAGKDVGGLVATLMVLKRRGCFAYAVSYVMQRPRLYAETAVQLDTDSTTYLLQRTVHRAIILGRQNDSPDLSSGNPISPFSSPERTAISCIIETILLSEISVTNGETEPAHHIASALCKALTSSTKGFSEEGPLSDVVTEAERARRAVDVIFEAVAGASKIVSSGSIKLAGTAEIEVQRGLPSLLEPLEGMVSEELRRRVVVKFSDVRNLHHSPESLCHASVYCIQHTPAEVLQSTSARLLSPILQGVSTRLSSPLPSHRKLACIAARCLSMVLTPDEPASFEDHPLAYENWLSERCDWRISHSNNDNNNTPEIPQKKPKKIAPPEDLEEIGAEDAFGFDDNSEDEKQNGSVADETGDDTDSAGFWSSEDEAEVVKPIQNHTTNIKPPILLQDALSFLQGKMEDAAKLTEVLEELPLRLASERIDEVTAVGPALFQALLHLQNQYNVDTFDANKEESLVLLLSKLPSICVRHLVDKIWGPNMSTIQRIEALKLLSASASRLRLQKAPEANPLPTASSDPTLIYSKGVASVRTRREYPPIFDDSREVQIRETVLERLETKTKRSARKQGGVVEYTNGLDSCCAVFVYNLVGTTDRSHFNPVASDDVLVLAELLRYLWHMGELLHGCRAGGDAEAVLRVILDFVYQIAGHSEAFIVANVLACAAATILSLPVITAEMLPMLNSWVAVAQEVRYGKKGKGDTSCASVAASLMVAVQRRLDDVVGAAMPSGGIVAPSQSSMPMIQML